ncbi:hypothetical protein [Gloeocapsopsis dulcis]|uniref:hypothetical protein n=1 Tax=Gloeocapsopsis dulcis TaxID=2859516 RepID=UPI0012DA8818|nr:hypothetical protein [Gloeocapsopsis dulcis]WNN87849.1 hypothetical protein P0S91_16210 [Gloeocapsopsis dulcis]
MPQTLASIQPNRDPEMIVADGGSYNATVGIVQSFGAKVFSVAAANRACRMNYER